MACSTAVATAGSRRSKNGARGTPTRRCAGLIQSAQVGSAGLVGRTGVARIIAGDCIEEDGSVLRRSADGSAMIERRRERDDAADGDCAVGGFETTHAAMRGGRTNGAAGIGSDSRQTHTGGDGDGRSARRAAAGEGEIPGIAHRTIEAGGRCSAKSKFMQIRFTDEDGSCIQQAIDHFGIGGGDAVLVKLTGGGSSDAGGVDVVFQGNG